MSWILTIFTHDLYMFYSLLYAFEVFLESLHVQALIGHNWSFWIVLEERSLENMQSESMIVTNIDRCFVYRHFVHVRV